MSDEPAEERPVHVRWVAPSAVAGPVDAWLDDVERERLGALPRAEDRRRFELSRHLLKVLVSELAGVLPSTIRLDYSCARCGRAHGRPVVAEPEPARGWSVSIAHASDRVLVAASSTGPVGVDVESVAAVDFAGFDGVVLTAAERAELATVAPEQQGLARVALWVRKEAILKAWGDGLRVEPATVDVAAWPGVLEAVDVGSGYAAATAMTLSERPRTRIPRPQRFALRSQQTRATTTRQA